MELDANRFELLRRRLYRRVERIAQVCPSLFRGCSAGPMRSGLLVRAISRAFLRGSLALFRGIPAFISSSPALIQFGAARRAAAVRVLFHAKYRSIYNIAKIRLLGEEPAFCKSQKRWPAIRRVAKGLANKALEESKIPDFVLHFHAEQCIGEVVVIALRAQHRCLSGQFVEQRLGVFEVSGVEAFGEPAVDFGEHRARVGAAALRREQPGRGSSSPVIPTIWRFDCARSRLRAESSLRLLPRSNHPA